MGRLSKVILVLAGLCCLGGTWIASPGKGSHGTGAVHFAEVQQVNYAASAAATSHNVTIASATAGNLLVVCMVADATTGTLPSGFTNSSGSTAVDFTGTYIFYKVAAGGETTITLTPSSSAKLCATVFEFSGMDTGSPFDVQAAATGQGGAGTASCGTTAATAQANELVVAVLGQSSGGSGGIRTVTAWSDSLVEQNQAPSTGTGSNVGITAAYKTVSATGTQTTTATLSGFSSGVSGTISTFKITNP